MSEAAEIVGQAGAPDRFFGALEKLAEIHGLAGDLINHRIGLFLGYAVMKSIKIVMFDAGAATCRGGGKRVL